MEEGNSRTGTFGLLSILAIIIILFLVPSFPTIYNTSRTLSGPLWVNATNSASFVQLGFSPTTLVPANESLPTFTVGDNMWFLQNSATSVNLMVLTPGGEIATNKTIMPGVPTLAFTFTESFALDGYWTLKISGQEVGNLSIPVSFVSPDSHEMNASMTSYSFLGNSLDATYSISAPGSYGVEGCLLPQNDPGAILFSTPSSIGSDLALQNAGNQSISVSTGGIPVSFIANASTVAEFETENSSAPKQSFEFWLELYYPYTFSLGSGTAQSSSYKTSFIEVANTNPVVLSYQQETAYPQLNALAGLRNGTYELRVFVEEGGNLSVQQTMVLLQGPWKPWVWLGGCQASAASGNSIMTSIDLSNSSSNRPSSLFLSYYYGGVNMFLLQPAGLHLGELTLYTSKLEATPSNIGVLVNVTDGEYGVIGESFFIASVSSQVLLNYSLTFGGKVFQRSFPSYYYQSFGIIETDLGKLDILTTFDGVAFPNATLELTNDALNGTVSLKSNLEGSAVFFGPPGNYTLVVSSNATSLTRHLVLSAGAVSSELISLNEVSNSQFLTQGEFEIVILGIVIAALGIAADIWVLILKPRGLKKSTKNDSAR